MINELLQWIVIVWTIWAIHDLGKAIISLGDCMKEITKWEQNRRDKENENSKDKTALTG